MPGIRFAITDQQQRALSADQWAQQQREKLADDWAAQTQVSLQPTPSDSLTNPLGTGNRSVDQTVSAPFADAGQQLQDVTNQVSASPTLPRPDAPVTAPLVAPTTQPSPISSPAPPPSEAAPVSSGGSAQPAPLTPSSPVTAPLVAPSNDYEAQARAAAVRHGLDPDIFVRQLQQESGLNPYNADGSVKTSPAGARGIAQFMPDTARGLGINPDDPAQAIEGAALLMQQNLQRYGGDYGKALAAYNAGPGNVDKYGGIPPFQETKTYVSNILGGAGQAVSSAVQGVGRKIQDAVSTATGGAIPASSSATQPADLSLSQFGDKTLTAEEAYAACGPAAAARLATIYGDNIPLSAALAAAKQVGWTPQGGMNGIANEKKLMDALGLPAELDTSGDWNKIISDASSGKVVTISTPGHYFTANGTRPRADGQTELYVGQSGLDLKGGKAWMTPSEIEGLMGQVNGALTSDPGKAAQAGDWMQKASVIAGQPTETTDDALKSLQDAQQKAGLSSAPQQPGSPLDAISRPFGDAFQALGDVAGQVGGAIQSADQQYGPNALLTKGEQAVGQGVGAVFSGGLKDTVASELDRGALGPMIPAPVQSAAAGFLRQPGALDSLQTVDDLRKKYGTMDSSQYSPEDRQAYSNAVVAVGGMASPLENSANPLIQRTGQMLNAKPPIPPADTIATRLVRAWTNRYVNIDQFQEETARLVGMNPRNLPQEADAQALVRLSSDPAAEVRIQQQLGPAIRTVGDDQPWLSAYLMHSNNVDVAKQLGNPNRKFPGGFTAADSAQVLADLPTEVGPQRYAKIQQAADDVSTFVKGIRQRMVDSGLIDQTTATQWETQYPNWVPTRILDYMDEAGQSLNAPRKFSLGDAGVKKYTLEGTARFAEDPLGSLVGLARSVETRARKNEVVNAIVNLDQMRPQGQQLLQQTKRPPTAGENVVQRINNGTVERYVAPPELAAVINGPTIAQAPGYVRAFTNFQRAVTTVLSPAFALVRNPSLDVPEYMTRELSRSGGNPLALPGIVADLMRGYTDAFKGFPQGQYGGATARFLQEGGGGAGMVTRTAADRQAVVQALGRSNALEIRSVGDIQRILKDVLTLQPVSALAQRTELGPRTASFIRAERAGATPARAALAGRQVTLDFNEGGTLAKTINSFVPFFNVGFQGTAQIPRMIRENPVGAASSIALTVGMPSVLAQAWNRADSQRSQDYEDVPQYLKDQGIVVMLPGDAPTDAKGNRKPQFMWLNMRGFAPFSSMAREATDSALSLAGDTNARPQSAQDLLGGILWSVAPIRANALGDVPGAVTASNFPLPAGGTALQLAANKDFFRQSDIVSKYGDQNAPQLAKEIASALTEVAQVHDPNAEIHPSQVNFAVRELLGGVGSSILGARELLPGGQQTDVTPQGAPVVGGALRAFGVRGDTGESVRQAVSQPVSPDIERALRDAGLGTPTIPTSISVRSTVTGSNSPPIELRQNERAEYQQLLTQRLNERLMPILSQPGWSQRSIQNRNAILDGQMKAARDWVESQLFQKMGQADRQARMQAGRLASQPKPKP